MGIKGLSAFLKKKFPNVFEPAHISEYALCKVAVDTSLYVHIFKARSFNPDFPKNNKWLKDVFYLVSMLRKWDVHPIFIYDTGAPKEKDEEKAKRRETKEKSQDRVSKVEDAVAEYHISGEISDVLLEYQTKRKIPVSLLGKFGNRQINIQGIEQSLKKNKKQLYEVYPEDFPLTRTLFKILDIPILMSPMEGETLCADLCVQGKVDAILSEDTDSLAYECPVFLTKVSLDGSCIRIRYEKVLEEMGLTSDEFLDFAIMCGTDYNKNIPNIGPVKAYNLIKKFSSLEKIEESGIDISILKHKRGRELFRNYPKSKERAKYVGTPDFEKLEEFIEENSLRRKKTVKELEEDEKTENVAPDPLSVLIQESFVREIEIEID